VIPRDAAAPGDHRERAEQAPKGNEARSGHRQREPFGMIPQSLIEALPAMALKLFCYLDLRQGENGWPVRGYRKVGRALGWKADTVAHWAAFLAAHGIIDITGEGCQARTMAVTHNPARKRPSSPARPPAVPERSDRKGHPYPAKRDSATPRNGTVGSDPLPRETGVGLGLRRYGVGLSGSESGTGNGSRAPQKPAEDDFGAMRCGSCGEWKAHTWDAEHAAWYCAECEPFVDQLYERDDASQDPRRFAR
jgi:hypothetical protein